jgi:SAM-dependent methyltransferase
MLVSRPLILPDFDASILPPAIRVKMLSPRDGICMNCGIYQRLDRLTGEEIELYLAAVKSKDATVSEEVYHEYPVPTWYIEQYENNYFRKRPKRWDNFFADNQFDIKRALILRTFFGAVPEYLARKFRCEVHALEISDIARRTTQDRVPSIRFLEGNIHGALSGRFLSSEKYDAVFVQHVIQHCVSLSDTMAKLRRLLRPGGILVLSQEIGRKPHNPFHINHLSEWQLEMVLKGVFERVVRIDDCDDEVPPFVSAHTKKADAPDLVAFAG